MRAYHISDQDLLEEARLHGKVTEISKVETATIERNGQISVISAKE
jgi:uncharacterized membrane protein YcaP (DUF421 family)